MIQLLLSAFAALLSLWIFWKSRQRLKEDRARFDKELRLLKLFRDREQVHPSNLNRVVGVFYGGGECVVEDANVVAKRLSRPAPKVVRPPGSMILAIVEFLAPIKLFREVYSQVIADSREEIFDYLRDGKRAHARRAWIWMHINIVWATIRMIPPKLWGSFKTPGR